ncbi:MAG: hypothetical protein RIR11_1241 [Bacteroidota bacterium]|jgi:hypothetical protein
MRHLLLLCCLFWLAQPLFSQTNYYTVKFPDDKDYIGCNASVPVESPVITQYSCSTNVGVSRYDLVYNSNESGSCYKIMRRWRLIYWCDYNPNMQPLVLTNPTTTTTGITAIGNTANKGYLEYTQVITVRDAEPPVFTTCPASPVTFCDYTNNNTTLYGATCEGPVDLQTEVSDICSGTDITLTYRLFLDLDANGSMETYVYTNGPGAWPVEKTIVGNKVRGKIVFPTNYQLPYGLHKIEWVANDKCGNESICKYSFEVKDCKNPTVVCKNGLSINIMQSGMITLGTLDFLQYTLDNCTPTADIKTAIRKAGSGLGFPTGNTSVTFDCSELGAQPVEIWAVDAAGNADFCTSYVIVQDNSNSCAPTSSISGTVLKPGGQAMPGIQITALKNNQTIAATGTSTANGAFGPLPVYAGCYLLQASSSDQTLNPQDITTWDAMLAGLHEYAVTPFDQPWQFVAADVNGDGWITPEDGFAITQVAIGGAVNWPGVPNWQFISANSAVPVDEITLNDPQLVCAAAGGSTPLHFIGVKTGDLDHSAAQLVDNDNLEERSAPKRKAVFSADDVQFEAGETVTLTINAPEATGLAGFQFTLDYNPLVLTAIDVQQAGLENVQIARFDAAHQITAGWQNVVAFYPDGASLFKGKGAITIVFQAQQAGKLSEQVFMNAARIPSEVYTTNMRKHDAELKFALTSNKKKLVQMLPVSPDPTTGDEVLLRYNLPVNTTARVIITDGFGRIVRTQQVSGDAGYHEVMIPMDARTSGNYLVQLTTDAGIDTQRVVVKR